MPEEPETLNDLIGYYRRLVNDYTELLALVGALQIILREKGVFSDAEFQAVVANVTALREEAQATARLRYESQRERLRQHEGDPQ